MARANRLINNVRAGAESNQELFSDALEDLISEWCSQQQHVATLPGSSCRWL